VPLLYLDYNCFQRPFDDPLNPRINIEAIACMEIIRAAEEEELELVWSFMHDDETQLCPLPERRTQVARIAEICKRRQPPVESIRRHALRFVADQRLSAKDALHLAAAIEAKADFLLTCDDVFLRRAVALTSTLR
jgi:predicted nucleic acid-binding protein